MLRIFQMARFFGLVVPDIKTVMLEVKMMSTVDETEAHGIVAGFLEALHVYSMMH